MNLLQIFLLLNLLDIVSTSLFVSKLGIEAELNPIPKIYGWGVAIFIKTFACLWFIYVWKHHRTRLTEIIFIVLDGIFVYVVVTNFLSLL